MIPINPRKNEYGHEMVKCPFCSYETWVRDSTKTSPDPLRDLKRHITNQAKNEAFSVAIDGGEREPTPHLKYYREHTSDQPVAPKIVKRKYDEDITLERHELPPR